MKGLLLPTLESGLFALVFVLCGVFGGSGSWLVVVWGVGDLGCW